MKSTLFGVSAAIAICLLALLLRGPAAGVHVVGPASVRLSKSSSTAAADAAYAAPVDAIDAFAFRLARAVQKQDPKGNMLICPYSAFVAHSMLLAGATGETQRELQSALAVADPVDAVHAKVHDLTASLTSNSSDEIRVANAFYSMQPIDLDPAFLGTLRHDYAAEFFQLHGTDSDSLAKVNGWVRDKTAGMVPKLLDRLDPQTVCAIVNASCFVGKWYEPFDPKNTKIEPFTLAGGTVVQVPIMHLGETGMWHYKDDRVEAVKLGYRPGAFEMIVLLPAAHVDVSALLGSLDAERWRKIVGKYDGADVYLSMPKFAMDEKYDLIPALKSMGISRLFGGAELSGMSASAQGLRVDKDVHATHIEVDEKGTRAAGVTASLTCGPAPPVHFDLNRPFIYAIVEQKSNLVLFLGICGDPRSKS
jgi:serpin B